jgi:hypothetical protein
MDAVWASIGVKGKYFLLKSSIDSPDATSPLAPHTTSQPPPHIHHLLPHPPPYTWHHISNSVAAVWFRLVFGHILANTELDYKFGSANFLNVKHDVRLRFKHVQMPKFPSSLKVSKIVGNGFQIQISLKKEGHSHEFETHSPNYGR